MYQVQSENTYILPLRFFLLVTVGLVQKLTSYSSSSTEHHISRFIIISPTAPPPYH
jgi:hypothetical protein